MAENPILTWEQLATDLPMKYPKVSAFLNTLLSIEAIDSSESAENVFNSCTQLLCPTWFPQIPIAVIPTPPAFDTDPPGLPYSLDVDQSNSMLGIAVASMCIGLSYHNDWNYSASVKKVRCPCT